MDAKEGRRGRVSRGRRSERGVGDREEVSTHGIQAGGEEGGGGEGGGGRGGGRGMDTKRGGRGRGRRGRGGERGVGDRGAVSEEEDAEGVSTHGIQAGGEEGGGGEGGGGRGGGRGMDTKRGGRGRGRRGRGGERGVGDRGAVSEEGIKGRGGRRGGEVRGRGQARARGSIAQAEGRESKGQGSSESSLREYKGTEKRGQKSETGQGERGGTALTTKGEGRNGTYLDNRDFLHLLKLLHITLPEGVITSEAIDISKTEKTIQDAKTIVQNLENFNQSFKAVPRLPSRKVKNCLALKDSGNVLDLTQLIFFERRENGKKDEHKNWETNRSKTGNGFKLKPQYMQTPISTPLMYSTTYTRSWEKLKVGTDSPRLTEGVRVNLKAIECRKFADESALWNTESPSKKFGKNDADEGESLKFFHELGVVTSDHTKVSYTKGNKVEYGFLTGKLDFLAQFQNGGPNNRHERTGSRLVIECKSTTGDMLGKLYTKIPNSQNACVDPDHEYSFQVQTYMYILNKVAKRETSPPITRAVMVLRHYHEGGQPPRDFHWSYLKINEDVQNQIDALRVYCQREVLGCFLAVLNLIFEKEN